MPPVGPTERICVIGAGPAGISTAYELARLGYEHVTVLERADRVGGLCLSAGFEGRAFDLGANYVTSSYREVRRLARRLDAPLYTETKGTFFVRDGRRYRSILDEAKGTTGLFSFGWGCLRYLWKRWTLGRRLPEVGYAGVRHHPDLMKSFADWLRDNELEQISTLCSIPVTLMGYGRLGDVPAPYVITYLTPRTFLDLMIYGSGLPRRWPKRFVDGFQRLFERMSWKLDVRLSTTVTRVERHADGVDVTYERPVGEGWHGSSLGPTTGTGQQAHSPVVTERFDRLVLCCPLQDADSFLALTDEERELVGRIRLNPFATTTYVAHDPALPARLVNVAEEVDAEPSPDHPRVSIVTQQFEGNPLVTFYTPLPARLADADEWPCEKDDGLVLDGVRELAGEIGLDLERGQLFSCDQWPYFPHVSVEDFADGWYDRIEALQGTNRTFYGGGVMCFELIEPIVRYSQDLARRRIAGGAR
ncbi:MAG: FAD-dependent oxidoreductase [Candidatus Nanopelagicales bacterium]